jgi:hypothetical protein
MIMPVDTCFSRVGLIGEGMFGSVALGVDVSRPVKGCIANGAARFCRELAQKGASTRD